MEANSRQLLSLVVVVFLLLSFPGPSQARLPWLHRFLPKTWRAEFDGSMRSGNPRSQKAWWFRGGDAAETHTAMEDDDDDSKERGESSTTQIVQSSPRAPKSTKKVRRTAEMIWDLKRRSGLSGDDESMQLRKLVADRAKEYIEDVMLAVETNETKLPHPRKLLHYLAPKVPAIKLSPDVNLRVFGDSGLAACIIATVGHACEIYDQEMLKRTNPGDEKPRSAAPDLTTDRRFEQLIECVLSGVRVKKRKRESLMRKLQETSEHGAEIEDILDDENAQEDEGLKIRDSCRAVWGIAVLGAHHLDTLGGEKVLDLLLALSLRVREVMLARLQNIRQDDLLSESWMSHLSPEERLNELAEELAEDAVSCMWAFACVRACTGQTSPELFETCCSILCQDPIAMRKRAQDGVVKNIGSSDVVHRLAHAEETGDSRDDLKCDDRRSISLGKDAFLDWLSPTEMNDVLWALALHGGSNSSSASDEINLSDTAAALREIAFDRILDFLQEDLESSDTLRRSKADSKQAHSSDIGGGDHATTVEVVDAATLLSSNEKSSVDLAGAAVEKLPVENISLISDPRLSSSGDVQEVQVVDAASLLASGDGDVSEKSATEVMVTSVADEIRNDLSFNSGENDDHTQRTVDRKMVRTAAMFTPHDLASMAWSVTELRDSLRTRVMGIIVELISRTGKANLEKMSSSDLSNLAWAISRYQKEMRNFESSRSASNALSIMQWVVESSLEKSRRSSHRNITGQSNVLDVFQPPELGRLMWAIAFMKSSFSHKMKSDLASVELSQLVLSTTAKNLSLFGTEDVLRIMWAFVELGEDHTSFMGRSSMISLGRVLATVEQSLHRWERGECHVTASEPGPASESVFSSFLGRPRRNLSYNEYAFGETESEFGDAHILEKSRRPRLQDLSVDPSTLCKAASAFQRLAKGRPLVKGGWTLTRVALRLLTSRDARLMKECSINDIVNVCEAAALTDAGDHGRELLLGLFARKLLQVLNHSLEKGNTDEVLFDLLEASPIEISTLLWALGELGAKHSLSADNDAGELAYKKMRLVSERSLLSKEDLASLDLKSSMKLLRGLVLMRFCDSDECFLLTVLKEVEAKSRCLVSGDEFCALAETIALLMDSLRPRKSVQTKLESNLETNLVPSSTTFNDSADDINDGDDQISPIPMNESATEDDLWDGCARILQEIAVRVKEIKGSLTATEMRRVLTVYSFLPFRADDLINELGPELSRRILQVKSSLGVSLEAMVEKSQSHSQAINRTLFKETDNSAFTSLKNGFLSLFQAFDEENRGDETSEENKLTEALASLVQKSVSSSCEVSDKVIEWNSGSRASLDSLMEAVDEASLFEYGRCQELIAHYRRVEFSTGTFRSRYDKERRKDIAKRVLSRLLP